MTGLLLASMLLFMVCAVWTEAWGLHVEAHDARDLAEAERFIADLRAVAWPSTIQDAA